MSSSKIPDLKTVANSFSHPNDQDNAIAFNNYFANVGLEISKQLGAENEPEVPRRHQLMFLLKVSKEEVKVLV